MHCAEPCNCNRKKTHKASILLLSALMYTYSIRSHIVRALSPAHPWKLWTLLSYCVISSWFISLHVPPEKPASYFLCKSSKLTSSHNLGEWQDACFLWKRRSRIEVCSRLELVTNHSAVWLSRSCSLRQAGCETCLPSCASPRKRLTLQSSINVGSRHSNVSFTVSHSYSLYLSVSLILSQIYSRLSVFSCHPVWNVLLELNTEQGSTRV